MNHSKPFWTKWRVVAVVLAMCSTGPIYLVNRHDRVVKKWIEEQIRYTHYRFGSGLEHDLCVGNIKAGDSVESVILKYPTLKREEYGRWTVINQDMSSGYYSLILAKDEKLVSAHQVHAYFLHDHFFEAQRTPEELADLAHEYFLVTKRRREKTVAGDRLKVALAGAAANVQFHEKSSKNSGFYFPDLNDPSQD